MNNNNTDRNTGNIWLITVRLFEIFVTKVAEFATVNAAFIQCLSNRYVI